MRRLMMTLFVSVGAWGAIQAGTGSAAPAAPATTTVPGAGTTTVSTTSTTSTTTTTTTTLPSAVTTVPEGCAPPPVAQAVFVGRLVSKDPVAGEFEIAQVRAGTIGNNETGTRVVVRYGGDVKFLDVGTSYLVGVAPDPVTLALASTVRDPADLFGGAEVAGSNVRCPRFEAAARTINLDGTSIDTGVFSRLFDDPWRVVVAFVLPVAFVLAGLFGLVWLKRGTRSR